MPYVHPERRLNQGGPLNAFPDELPELYASGIRAVVSLLNIPSNSDVYESAGFSFLCLPIPDGAAPTAAQAIQFTQFVNTQISAKHPVAVHCEAGIGRTGTMIASYLISQGDDAQTAINRVRAVEGRAIETRRQIDFLEHFASNGLKTIRFEGQMLPKWAQSLDLAARICPVSEETRRWFSRFANASGVADSRTIILQCDTLLTEMRRKKDTIISEISRTLYDGQPFQIFAAWEYSLETMMQEARSRKTCSWHLESAKPSNEGDFGDGDITLHRV